MQILKYKHMYLTAFSNMWVDFARVKNARRDVDNIDHDKVNSFTITSFPSIKECADQSNTNEVDGINDMIDNTNLMVMMLIHFMVQSLISSKSLDKVTSVIC